MSETQEQLDNRDINFFDPPKDLMGGYIRIETRPTFETTLARRRENEQRYTNLTNCMRNMFYSGREIPPGWTPVGDTKAALINRLIGTAQVPRTLYTYWNDRTNRIDIVRLSSPSGNDPRLNNLFVSQDSGPTDFVTDPIFLITPGVILDTADKTKTGNVANIVNYFPTLSDIYIDILGLGNIIAAGGVTLSPVNGSMVAPPPPGDAAYQLSMRLYNDFTDRRRGINPDRFIQYFRADYEPTPPGNTNPRNNSAYFLGNPQKNPWINDHSTKAPTATNADHKREIEQFILMKLFGDTFQVEYLNSIINTPADTLGKTIRGRVIGRDNTVVLTVDKVVLLRCLINKVGCIHTNNTTKITSWYIPRFPTATELAAINRKAIIVVADQTVSHNLSMINSVRAVIDFQPVNNVYINGYSTDAWTPVKRALFIAFLRDTISLLEAKNNEINSYILSLNDFSLAKEYGARHKFKDIFVKYKTQYYKTVNNVTFILESTIDGNRFQKYAFNAREMGNPARYVHPGGNFTDATVAAVLPAVKTIVGTDTWGAGIAEIGAAAVGIQNGGAAVGIQNGGNLFAMISDHARSILAGAAATGVSLVASGIVTAVSLPIAATAGLLAAAINVFIVPQITLIRFPIPGHVITKAAEDTAAARDDNAPANPAEVNRPANETYRGRKYHTNLFWTTFNNCIGDRAARDLAHSFLYCFVRDFIPEIFEYGRHMKHALGAVHGGIPAINTNINNWYPNRYDLSSPTIISDYLRPPEDGSPVYTYSPEFQLIPVEEAEVPPGQTAAAVRTAQRIPATDPNGITHEYIQYAHLFISTFPVFSTPLLRAFFTRYATIAPREFGITLYEGEPGDTDAAVDSRRVAAEHISSIEPLQDGGGQFDSLSDFEKAATIAIDLYNEYYMCKLRESYCLEDGEKDLIRYKLLNIKGYIEMLNKEPDSLLEKELEYFLKDLASMPAVIAKLPEADEIIKKIQPTSRSNKVPLAQQASVSQVVKQNEGSKVSPSSLGFRRRRRISHKPIGWTRRLPYSSKSLGLTRRLPYSREPIRVRPEGGRRGRRTRKRQHKNRKTKKRV